MTLYSIVISLFAAYLIISALMGNEESGSFLGLIFVVFVVYNVYEAGFLI